MGNLPPRLTSIVGRVTDVVELKGLVLRNRLVTLTGAGGVGKTSLGIVVAAEVAARYSEGAWFCDLSTISEASLVPQSVAAALQVTEQAGLSISESIRRTIRDKDLLLVLDNCEHLVDACATLAGELLAGCPGLRILATSREPIGAAGETVWTVEPLSLPGERSAHPRVVSRAPAVQLFVERATQARPGFELDTRNAATIAAICHRLDGIPLALELCASRIRVMPPEEILRNLTDRFDLLTARPGARPLRQRTVRASIDWSYGLLDDAERALFRRLSVFRSSFDVDSVAAVCSGGPVPDSPATGLVSLVDKSMVLPARPVSGRARFRLLETMREYALERLRDNQEWELITGRHARHFLNVAQEAVPQLEEAHQVSWFERLDADRDNFRSALDWFQQADPAAMAVLAGALEDFWQTRGYFTEGREWLTLAVTVEKAPTRLRARLLRGLGNNAWRKGDFALARQYHDEAVAIARQLGDRVFLANALGDLGFALFGTDAFASAGPLFEEELAIARESGDRQLLGGALLYSGVLALQLERVSEARDFYIEALATLEELGHTNGIAYVSQMLGLALIQQGDLKGAGAAIDRSVQLQARLGDGPGLAGAISVAAELAATQGRLERAMLLYGAAEARFSIAGVHVPSLLVASRDRWLPAAKRRFGGRAGALLDEGARLDDERVIAFVMSDEDRATQTSARDGAPTLTEREREVAKLLATGLTNRQIASRLRVSERTIDAHSEHIRNKLGVRSRSQITAWIIEHRYV